jgi:hypothetical protein
VEQEKVAVRPGCHAKVGSVLTECNKGRIIDASRIEFSLKKGIAPPPWLEPTKLLEDEAEKGVHDFPRRNSWG